MPEKRIALTAPITRLDATKVRVIHEERSRAGKWLRLTLQYYHVDAEGNETIFPELQQIINVDNIAIYDSLGQTATQDGELLDDAIQRIIYDQLTTGGIVDGVVE